MSEHDIYKAIADDTRRAILAVLTERPLPVHEIAAQFPVSRPAISKHLRILTEAGLVRPKRYGQENRYELTPDALSEVAAWLGRFVGAQINAANAPAKKRA